MAESDTPSVDGLMRVLDVFGIRHGGECSDPAKPYSITVKVPGRGQTNCCGATVREAAQSAFDWLYALPLSPGDLKSESEVQTAHATSDCVGGVLLSALPKSGRVLDRSFDYVKGIHTPTVLVGFPPNDWESRDEFAAAVDAITHRGNGC